VKVTLTNERTSAQSVVVTAENGAFVFAPVAAGIYTLTTVLSGFENAVRPHLTVSDDQHLNVEFPLVPSGILSLESEIKPVPDQKADSERTADPKAGSALRFDYDDKPNYKPGEADSSTHPGGYSSGANADSYDLILDYVEAWDGQPAPTRRGPAPVGRGQEPVLTPQPRDQDGRATADERNDTHEAELNPAESKSSADGERSEINQAALEAWNENQFFSRGSDFLLHRKFTLASELFQRGVARFPESAKLQMGLGITLYARGLYDQAVSALVRATDMIPSDPRPYLLLGKAYNASRSESGEVGKRLERWVELDPKSAPAHYYYALSLWRGEGSGVDTDRIERSLKRAVALDPQFADALLELGALYAEQAKYSDAISEYHRALAISPDLAPAHYRLAQAYARTGDSAAAQTELALYQHLQQRKPVDAR
jgi:tetratricopeptide (TPR) repeat protein